MKIRKITALLILSCVSASTNAALLGRLAATEGGTDYQAYYDTESGLTWLADAQLSGTLMRWQEANTWASTLDINGVTGWRLPTTLVPDESCQGYSLYGTKGYGCSGGELGNLFYNVLGGIAGQSLNAYHNSNYDLFSNIQSGQYWSSTEYGAYDYVYRFDTRDGTLSYGSKYFSMDAWAVYDGDVAPVPLPASIWLLGSGLLGLSAFRRSRAQNTH